MVVVDKKEGAFGGRRSVAAATKNDARVFFLCEGNAGAPGAPPRVEEERGTRAGSTLPPTFFCLAAAPVCKKNHERKQPFP